jgi:hypothetical protein
MTLYIDFFFCEDRNKIERHSHFKHSYEEVQINLKKFTMKFMYLFDHKLQRM